MMSRIATLLGATIAVILFGCGGDESEERALKLFSKDDLAADSTASEWDVATQSETPGALYSKWVQQYDRIYGDLGGNMNEIHFVRKWRSYRAFLSTDGESVAELSDFLIDRIEVNENRGDYLLVFAVCDLNGWDPSALLNLYGLDDSFDLTLAVPAHWRGVSRVQRIKRSWREED